MNDMHDTLREAREYAYKQVPENPRFDIPLGWVLLFWAAVVIVIAVVAN